MKVMYIATYSGKSGASHSLVAMIDLLRNKGIKPLVIIPTEGPLEKMLVERNIPYKKVRLFVWVKERNQKETMIKKLRWKIKQIINLIQEARLLYFMRKHKIDIIHINAITANWGFLAAKKSRIPVIWHIREFLERGLGKEFQNKEKAFKYLNSADKVVAISNSVKDEYQSLIQSTEIEKVYNGIESDIYEKINVKRFNTDPVIFTLAGRIVPEKGHEDVIAAFIHLREAGFKNIKVKFVGDEGPSWYIKQLKKNIKDAELGRMISFEGYRSDMYNVWAETDVALVTTTVEAFGRVTVEAMMAGALVIGANTGGTAEIIGEDNGLVYQQGDFLSLASVIKEVIENREKYLIVARNARSYALEKFTAEKNALAIYNIYSNLLKK